MAKASDTEEEYFARENAERLRKLAAEQKKSLADSEREKLRKLHHMRCPKCGMELQEISVRGVQVGGIRADPRAMEPDLRGGSHPRDRSRPASRPRDLTDVYFLLPPKTRSTAAITVFSLSPSDCPLHHRVQQLPGVLCWSRSHRSRFAVCSQQSMTAG